MKRIFDYDDGDMAYSISDNMAIDSDGDFLIRLSIIWQWKWIQEKSISCLLG